MTTLDLQVSAGGDDGHETRAGPVNLTAGSIELRDNASSHHKYGAFWFSLSGVEIPAGATIDVAYLEPYEQRAGDDIHGDLDLENAASPAALSTTSGDISGRTGGGSAVSWTGTTVGGFVQSPSLIAPLQAVVDSSGELSAILSRITAHLGSTTQWFIRTYENDTTRAAKLHIEYTALAGDFVPTERSVSLQYMPVPDDWDEQTDGFCTLSVQVPNSTKWRIITKGLISALMVPGVWDAATGDALEAAKVGYDIYQSAQVDVP